MRDAAELVNKELKWPLVVAEIGVRGGGNAIDMLANMDIERMYLIDPYLPYTDGNSVSTEEMQHNSYSDMFKRMSVYFNKVVFVSKTSEFASALFEKEYFDFVYIDAKHEFEYIRNDINYWWEKIKIGGFIGGHDFNAEKDYNVSKAVKEFASINKVEYLNLKGSTDWIIKRVNREKK